MSILSSVFNNLKSKVLIIKVKKFKQFLKSIFFVVNIGNTNLLSNIINKNNVYNNNNIKRIGLKEIILCY